MISQKILKMFNFSLLLIFCILILNINFLHCSEEISHPLKNKISSLNTNETLLYLNNIEFDIASNPYEISNINNRVLHPFIPKIENVEKWFYMKYNSSMHESYPAAKSDNEKTPIYSSFSFINDVSTGKTTKPGRLFILSNPIGHWKVIQPLNGCGNGVYTVSKTILGNSSTPLCSIATNGGFFNTRTGDCLGNLVSNGNIVQAPGTLNANFGITRNGIWKIGYFSKQDIYKERDNFLNLVGGVIWLVRNGTNYVDQAAKIEDMSTQETGKEFLTVKASRVAIGHDIKGQLIIVQIDGHKDGKSGVDLYEFSDYLISIGVINAINLDGGGSATVLNKNVLMNYPTDHCEFNSAFRCERPVTSVSCIF